MKLIIAGGGTGGHLFPALALAEEFKKRDKDIEITFVGGKGGLEEKVVPGHGYELILLDVEGIKRRKGLRRIRALFKAFFSTLKALSLLRTLKPDGVIGSGSYSSAPVVSAARMLGIKTAILEQNALPGLTNRLLGRLVDRVYIAFEDARGYFPAVSTRFSGNPIRKEILKRKLEKVEPRPDRFTILVFGGSQGAVSVNAAFLDATEYLIDIWGGLRVIHQTGSEGFEAAQAAYKRKGLRVELFEFIDDMAEAYSIADLVVCRAGATSIAEITALGLASILIPYPFASDDHQVVNAGCLKKRGAAIVIRQDKLTGATLASEIRRLYENPLEIKRLREAVKTLGKPRASETIADDYLDLLRAKNLLEKRALNLNA